MENYIQQFLEDLEGIILLRWRKCLPHYVEGGIPNQYLKPPEGWQESDANHLLDPDSELHSQLSFLEIENRLKSKSEFSMFYQLGLEPEQFPPLNKLTEEQVEKLTFTIHRLWNAFNFTAVIPNNTPARIVYPILLERMHDEIMIANFGHVNLEFCHYEPKECPFGLDYCDCTQIEKEYEEYDKRTKSIDGKRDNELDSMTFDLEFDPDDDLPF